MEHCREFNHCFLQNTIISIMTFDYKTVCSNFALWQKIVWSFVWYGMVVHFYLHLQLRHAKGLQIKFLNALQILINSTMQFWVPKSNTNHPKLGHFSIETNGFVGNPILRDSNIGVANDFGSQTSLVHTCPVPWSCEQMVCGRGSKSL